MSALCQKRTDALQQTGSSNTVSTAHQRSAFRKMIYFGRQSDPMMHRLLVDRKSRRSELWIRERTHCDTVFIWESFTLPINVAAAIRAEMKADLVATIGTPRVNLARALDPHLAFQIGSAGMHNCTRAALTCCAVANIDAIRLTGCDDPQRPAMAQCRSFHYPPPSIIFLVFASRADPRPTAARWKVDIRPSTRSYYAKLKS
jgi:hypothetical protein